MDEQEEPKQELYPNLKRGRGRPRKDPNVVVRPRPDGVGAYKPTIREALLHNATLPERQRLTNQQIAQKLGVRVDSVYVASSTMRANGILAVKSARPSRDVPGPMAVLDPMAIVDRVMENVANTEHDGSVMSKDERAKKLSQIGRTAPAAVAVNAVTRLDEMERTSGITVGPPDPMTDEDRAVRLAKLMMVCSSSVRERALRILNPSDPPAPVIPPESHLEPESSERDLPVSTPTPSETSES